MSKIQGPKVKKLICERMATIAVPNGGGFSDAMKFLLSKEAITDAARKATEFVEVALKMIREAAEPNPWKNATDEEIAGHLLAEIEKKRSSSIANLLAKVKAKA